MLSKVGQKIRRRSVQFEAMLLEPRIEPVEEAPDLLRWSDFTDPFPPVALGGYTRYYSKIMNPDFPKSPTFCPVLSHQPEPLPSHKTPAASPLFFSSSPKRPLTVVREASDESLTPQKLPNLLINTSRSPVALRRKRRQLLRTPSVERDFGLYPRPLFASPMSNSAVDISSTHGYTHSHSHSRSSDANSSQSDSSASNHSELPTTPSTSLDSGDEYDGFQLGDSAFPIIGDKDWGFSPSKWDEILRRSESRTSFSTAKSDFDSDDDSKD